jgi:transcriptional regulator with XRE-family HTH domain
LLLLVLPPTLIRGRAGRVLCLGKKGEESVQLGEFLREERKRRKWSLKELGERLKSPRDGGHVSPQYLNDVEMGRRTPSEQILGQLATLLDKDIAILRAMSERGVPEVDEYLADLPDKGPEVGQVFRKAREMGFTDWGTVQRVIADHAKKKKRKK